MSRQQEADAFSETVQNEGEQTSIGEEAGAEAETSDEWIGKRVNSYDGRRFVTGHGSYLDDIKHPEMLHARFVRSQRAHAKVVNIDTTEAENHPGVEIVWTHEDIKDRVNEPYGYMLDDEEVLANDRVRYMGQELAVVLAEDRKTATIAADLVDVEYESLDPVLTIEEAQSSESLLVHPELSDDPTADVEGNVAWSGQVIAGNHENPMEDADIVVEETFNTNKTTPAPLEPHGCVAEYNPGDGNLELYSSSQFPHLLSIELADVIDGLDPADIICKLPDIGGGFGIKIEAFPFEICASLLSMETSRPVKHVLDRIEEFQAGRGRSDTQLHGRLGLTDDGDMVGLEVEMEANAGAFAAYSIAVAYSSAVCGHGPYIIPNQHWNNKVVYTNLMPSTAVRGFGDPQVTFMREQLIEMAAEEVGMDPIDLRLQNTPHIEDMPMRSPTGLQWRNSDVKECIRRVREMIDWEEYRGGYRTADGKLGGVGMGTIMKRGGNKSASRGDYDEAVVKMNRHGDVTILSAIASIGQGTETGICQLVADVLGLDVQRVDIVRGDTDVTPEGLGVWADRGTIIGGSAAVRAAEDLKETLESLAGHMLEVSPSHLEFAGGRVYDVTNPDNEITIDELADIGMRGNPETIGPEEERPKRLQGGISLVGRGKYQSQEVEFVDPETGRGNIAHSYTFGALAARVELNPSTGEVDVVDVAICEDVGKAVNPKLIEGQVQGGIVQALGESLYEKYVYDDNGTLTNGSMTDYHLPTMEDVPMITNIDKIENPDPTTSHGQKGVGECPLVPVTAAVSNAAADATGIRFTDLPLSADQVLPILDDAGLREI